MGQYKWQSEAWPEFRWNSAELLRPLGQARQAQGRLLGEVRFGLVLEVQAELFTQESMSTAAIEGDHLNRQAVRSSVARRLGLPTVGLPTADRRVEGLVEMLLDATTGFKEPLTASRLFGWNAALFPTGYLVPRPLAGKDLGHAFGGLALPLRDHIGVQVKSSRQL